MKKVLNFIKRAWKAYLKMCAENYVFGTTADCTIYCDPATGRAYVCKQGK